MAEDAFVALVSQWHRTAAESVRLLRQREALLERRAMLAERRMTTLRKVADLARSFADEMGRVAAPRHR